MELEAPGVRIDGPLWNRLVAYRIGPLPMPIWLLAAAILAGAAVTKKLPDDVIGGLLVIMLSGFLLGHIGGRIPVLKHIGGAAILCLFVPSALKAYGYFDPAMLQSLTTTMKTANFQYLYIAALVVGSILGMSYKMLVQGFMRMFIPLLVGTVGAIVAGVSVGLLFGFEPKYTLFYIVVPIVGGGIGEGILPLSIGYSEILGKPQEEIIGLLIPAALIGNVVAILSSGALGWLGEKRPELSGNGVLVRTGEDLALLEAEHKEPLEVGLMGAGLLLTCMFFTLGAYLSPYTGIPGPVLMIVTVALAKVLKILPRSMEHGAYQMYTFMTRNLTFAILVGLGTLFVPWKQMISSLTFGYFVVVAASVLAMVGSGFAIGRFMKMFPIESAIVTACHSGLGGTGDVAILSASNRMELMPFAQISTRLGGAAMVVLATIALKALS